MLCISSRNLHPRPFSFIHLFTFPQLSYCFLMYTHESPFNRNPTNYPMGPMTPIQLLPTLSFSLYTDFLNELSVWAQMLSSYSSTSSVWLLTTVKMLSPRSLVTSLPPQPMALSDLSAAFCIIDHSFPRFLRFPFSLSAGPFSVSFLGSCSSSWPLKASVLQGAQSVPPLFSQVTSPHLWLRFLEMPLKYIESNIHTHVHTYMIPICVYL